MSERGRVSLSTEWRIAYRACFAFNVMCTRRYEKMKLMNASLNWFKSIIYFFLEWNSALGNRQRRDFAAISLVRVFPVVVNLSALAHTENSEIMLFLSFRFSCRHTPAIITDRKFSFRFRCPYFFSWANTIFMYLHLHRHESIMGPFRPPLRSLLGLIIIILCRTRQ